MISFQRVTSIDDAEFNALYLASSFYMGRSNYPFWIHGLRDPADAGSGLSIVRITVTV